MTHQEHFFPAAVDLVVVGAGIVGLAHAVAALDRGHRVLVVDRDDRAVGASVRNFGHGCFTAQDGDALGYALDARDQWLRLAKETGLWLRESGTVVVARADDELAVLEQFVAARDGAATLLSARETAGHLPAAAAERGGVVGGALLPLDVRVDPRTAAGAIAAWVAARPGVRVAFGTTAQRFEPGADGVLVRTSRGDVRARRVVVAVGHDVDRFFPDLADRAGVRRCTLHMLRVALPGPAVAIDPAVLTGTSLLRYPGFARTPAAGALRDRLARRSPELLDAGVNLMLTQRADGTITLGDTHAYAGTPAPFRAEELDDLLRREGAALLGLGPREELRVVERWRGVYASAPEPFLVADALPGVRVVSVTAGIGMTTALGLAPRVLDDLL